MIKMEDLLTPKREPSHKDLLACARKRPYTQEIEARIGALADLDEREHQGVTEMWVYTCPVCGYWHTTSKGGSKEMRVTRDNPTGAS